MVYKSPKPPRIEPMKPAFACLLVFVVGAALAQSAPDAAKPASRATISGIVTKDPGREPVKKALIELISENQAEGGNYTAVTGPEGAFHIEGILPGRYRLFVERTGLLDVEKHRARVEGRVLSLSAGQELNDLQIRLQAAAVVRGRVTDEDGEPMQDAEVTVLRETYASGRRRWEQAGAERTNDLGEYRIANLPAGNYYVSVSPPPDFKSLIAASATADGQAGPGAADKPATSYQTSYYPGTTDRSQAAPIQLHAGDEFPASFSLTPSPSLMIRGSVVNLPPHASASIMLQSGDFNFVINGAEMHKDGSFVIRDVSPGAYTILATVDNSPVPMTARQTLQVVSNNLEGLRLAPQPGASVRGRLRLDSNHRPLAFDPSQVFLALQSSERADDGGGFTLGDGFSNLTHLAPDGSFEWKDVPPGDYYVQLVGEGDGSRDWFVKSVLAGSRDMSESGVAVNGGTVVLDLLVSTQGAVVEGVALDQKSQPVANAVVVAVPEARLRGRMDRYHKAVSDQSGHFILRGVPPGDYTLFAWESVDGDAYSNPEFLKSYEGQGVALHMGEGERKNSPVQVIADREEQP